MWGIDICGGVSACGVCVPLSVYKSLCGPERVCFSVWGVCVSVHKLLDECLLASGTRGVCVSHLSGVRQRGSICVSLRVPACMSVYLHICAGRRLSGLAGPRHCKSINST